ncbi:High mobility group protein DSP1 [Diplonema papillatum]|nr:High mobility group protein DSP1 [Diplonema papillatum]
MVVDTTGDASKEMKELIKSIIDIEGFYLTVTLLRKVVEQRISQDLSSKEEDRKAFRRWVEECLKELLYVTPSLVDTLKAPQVTAGVGKRVRVSSAKGRTSVQKTPRKSGEKKKKSHTSKAADGAPPPPKKPLSSFFIYTAKHRERVKAANPDVKFTEYASILGEEWSKLADDHPEKVQCIEENAAAKEKYAEAMKAYVAEHGGVPSSKRASKSKKVTPDGPPPPKRAMSAYMHFSMASRETIKEKNPELDNKDILSAIGKEWSALAEDAPERKKAEEAAAEDKKRQEREDAEYVEKNGQEMLSAMRGSKTPRTGSSRPAAKKRKLKDGWIVGDDHTSTASASSSTGSSSSSSSSGPGSDSDSGSSSSSSSNSSSSSSS